MLLNRPLHGAGSQGLGNALSDEHFDGFLIDRQIDPDFPIKINR
jgi:hypothetical protein